MSIFQSQISGVPKGFVLGPIVFDIFLKDLLTLENSEIYNFADGNTIFSISKEKETLLTTLEKDLEKAVYLFIYTLFKVDLHITFQ